MAKHKPRLPKLCCVPDCNTVLSEHGSYICKHHLQYLSPPTRKLYNAVIRRTDGINTEYFDRKELIGTVKAASEEIARNKVRDL